MITIQVGRIKPMINLKKFSYSVLIEALPAEQKIKMLDTIEQHYLKKLLKQLEN